MRISENHSQKRIPNVSTKASNLVHQSGHPKVSSAKTTNGSNTRIKHMHGTPVYRFAHQTELEQAVEHFLNGKFGFVHFANIIALSSIPNSVNVAEMNMAKGSEALKAVSVSTPVRHIPSVFDENKLPNELDTEKVMGIVTELNRCGPSGIILPASENVPEHLSVVSPNNGSRTVQVINAGDDSHFNRFLEAVIARIPENFIAVTSANVSSHTVGAPSPVHYQMRNVLKEFEGRDNFFALVQPNERKTMTSYLPIYLPMSTSIFDLTDIVRDNQGEPIRDAAGRYIIRVNRWGSMHINETERIMNRHGFGVIFPEDQIARRYYNGIEKFTDTKIRPFFNR